MQLIKFAPGVSSLKSIAATASSARVLDLSALALAGIEDPHYLAFPFFIHPVLNRSILVKHNVRWGEDDPAAPRRFNVTKVIFPFDADDMGLGGQYLYVDQADFVGLLTRHLDYRDLPLQRDLGVLRAIDRLPTLDPFLLSETLNRSQIEVGRCYYRFSDNDRARMLDFVSGEIEALIRLCFGEIAINDERTRRLSLLLLSDQDSHELEPLRETFRMDVVEFSEAIFSWKAFLYYRWRTKMLAPELGRTLNSITVARRLHGRGGETTFIVRAARLLERSVRNAWREANDRLGLYDEAFASLTAQRSPENFRAFLANGASLFLQLGHRIGRLEQAASFWDDRFGGARVASMTADEVADGLRDILQALSVGLGRRAVWEEERAVERLAVG
jgi:hypothetical protein